MGCLPVAVTLVLEGEDGTESFHYNMQPSECEVVKIGRSSKSNIVLSHPGLSGNHAELRLVPKGPDGHFVVGVCDLSSNGTGIRLNAAQAEPAKLDKNFPYELPDGAIVVLPLKVGPSGKVATTLQLKYDT